MTKSESVFVADLFSATISDSGSLNLKQVVEYNTDSIQHYVYKVEQNYELEALILLRYQNFDGFMFNEDL